ncbi:Neuronal pentraxin receptor [Bagarius yarrelli]|uniref:Neuronal pentraxin receptor n=1 Tax=Bagarius yarrelli TaxID=175774 RepID=A0A556TV11_BAGYA|nr:Neuronal pentraxin receptor [Bagarius yarrelli]
MVAFVGAVICIIAAVHGGSPSPAAAASTAAQPLAENQSLTAVSSVFNLPPGSVARAGPLDALHGSGERNTPESPTFYGITSVSSGGDNGKQQVVTVNRLICTPVPPGECRQKGLQADDQSVYAGDQAGDLRATAEELRRTVEQQEEEIRAEQHTIRELSGKLSVCERGTRSESLRTGKRESRDGLMMQDDAGAPALTVRELEKAILHMKERIEKLEAEMAPLAQNHTETVQKGKGSVPSTITIQGAKAQRRVEDLERELKRKMQVLEEERKALRKETQKHQQHIDHGLDAVHQRISSLEKAIPTLHAFTVCMWLKPVQGILGTAISYAVSEEPHELVLQQLVNGPVELLIKNEMAQFYLNLTAGSWQHVCLSWNRRGGVWHAYVGSKLKGEGKDLATRHYIRPGGTLILGQEQSSVGGHRFEASRALFGDLSQFNMWDRPLTRAELSALAHCSTGMLGNVVPWTSREVEVFGGVTKQPSEHCSHQTRVQE